MVILASSVPAFGTLAQISVTNPIDGRRRISFYDLLFIGIDTRLPMNNILGMHI